ncbi:MAG: hypothetical protein OM95_06420 [Bdellovibrio sp. ArHS]|uniref:hypothetical protein n=1 Tax=Bdellovibrio sp. ArHS TaxID=1569284 RepID=UPI000583E515|nr:hypothetical protein [Bdellovibrio sp. ArHS]KHD88765.1 MAG: hypothetical protein OM95_06420 [Bdellovibrio sp. ArHS]
MTLTKKGMLPFKVLLSLWIVYNIFTMFVMPNVGAYFGRATANFITPYANTVGLNASWNFFSPDPAHTMYVRYTVRFSDEEGNDVQEPVEGYFPAEKNKGISNATRKRELYAMRFMVIEPKRLRLLYGPWLCKQYPGASSVEMEHVIETVPPLDQVVLRRDETVKDLSQELQYVREYYSCTGGADEEAL